MIKSILQSKRMKLLTFNFFISLGLIFMSQNVNACSATVSVSGSTITVNGLTGAYKEVNFLNAQWQSLGDCNTWGGSPCSSTPSFTAPSPGTYYVLVKSYNSGWGVICGETVTVTVSSGGSTPTNTSSCQSEDLLVFYDLDACVGKSAVPGSSNDFSEFTASLPSNSGCVAVTNASVLIAHPHVHSCVSNGSSYNIGAENSANAPCSIASASATFDTAANDSYFSFKVSARELSGNESLTKLSFYYRGATNSRADGGQLNTPGKVGVRVFKNGTNIFTEKDFSVDRFQWQLYTIDLSNDPDFQLRTAYDEFEFRIVGYEPIDLGGTYPIHEIDQIRLFGSCSEEDTDNDGVCDSEDCKPNNPAFPATPGTTCNDGNSNTINDVVQNDGCSCAGTVAQVFDCPALSANIGDACNDFNSNTTNDKVQSDCSCRGTVIPPTGGNTCNAVVSVVGNTINVTGLDNPIVHVQITDANWSVIFSCDSWDTNTSNCGSSVSFNVPASGSYNVFIKTYNSSWANICNIFETVTVGGGTPTVDCPALNANIGDACNDYNPNTTNDVVQPNCACAGTTSTPVCNNVTDGGKISGDETGCGSYNPGPITNQTYPSGGSGTVEYLWLSSTTGCPRSLSYAIAGANKASYTPGTISQTTYYVRCSRRAGCADWAIGESNCVVKTVDNDPNCGGSNGGCNIAITSGADFITVSGVTGGPYPFIGISDDFGNSVYQCHVWNGGCPTSITVDGLAPGVYWVTANVIADDFTTRICEAFEDPIVGGGLGRNAATNSNTTVDNNTTKLDARLPNTTEIDFRVFPNPAREVVNVSLESYMDKDITIQLIDYTGKPIKSVEVDSVNIEFYTMPTSNIENGIYTVRILSNGMVPISKKMIVSK